MTYGARLVSIRAPDHLGQMADVVLGYDTLQGYLNDTETGFGAVKAGLRIASRWGASRLMEKPTRFL